MLTVTESACALMSQILSGEETPKDEAVVIRLIYRDSNLGMAFDQVRAGDASFDHDGEAVLVIEPQLAEALAGHTLDVEVTDAGPQLAMRPSETPGQ